MAAGADGAVAGHGGEEFVAPGRGELGDAVFAQLGDQRTGERGGVAGLEQGGDAAHAELVGAERGDLKAEVGQRVGVFFDGGDVERVGGEDGRDQQRLGGDLAVVEGGLQLFVEDAFVRGVHVDKDEAAGVLGQDVNAVQLGEGVAERRAVPVDRFGRGKLRCAGRDVSPGGAGEGEVGGSGGFGYAEGVLVAQRRRVVRDKSGICRFLGVQP